MILPDSTIEVAARAIYGDGKCSCYDCELERANARTQAGAALTAALPDLIEICAKVAEGVETISVEKSEEDDPVIMAGFMGEFGMKRAIVHAIRSLLTTPEDK